MICDKCGGERVHWRCDNYETQLTKYKCLDCGHIMSKKKELKPLFNKKEINHLKKEEKESTKRKHRKARKEVGKFGVPKNYARTFCNTFMVTKWIDGKQQYFGTYKTEKDAKFVVSKFREYGWDKKNKAKIVKELCKFKESV